MACKMDDWEIEHYGREDKLNVVGKQFNNWKWEILDTIDWVNNFLALSKKTIPDKLKPWMDIAKKYIPDPEAIKWNEVQKSSEEQFSSAIVEDQNRRRYDWYMQLAAELEISLCSLRTWILQNYLAFEGKLPDALVLQLERERCLHVSHRVSELKKEIEIHKSQISNYSIDIQLNETAIRNMIEQKNPELDHLVKESRERIIQLKNSIEDAKKKISAIESVPVYRRVIER